MQRVATVRCVTSMRMAGHVGWQKAPSSHARDPGFEFPRYGNDTVQSVRTASTLGVLAVCMESRESLA